MNVKDLILKDEDYVQLDKEWVLVHQKSYILIFHIHEDRNEYCRNGKCNSCGKSVPVKIAMIGKFRKI